MLSSERWLDLVERTLNIGPTMLFLCPTNYELAHSWLASLPANSSDRISRRRIWPAVKRLVCEIHFHRNSNASRVVWFEAPAIKRSCVRFSTLLPTTAQFVLVLDNTVAREFPGRMLC